MLNEGRYTARASEAAWNESQNGNFYLVARFVVSQGEAAGQSCTKKFHFTDATVDRTYEDLRVCGWTGTDPAEIGTNGLAGIDTNEVSITVEHETYNDRNTGEEKKAAQIKWINPLNRALSSNADAHKLREFGRSMAARFAAFDARNRATGAAPVQQRVTQQIAQQVARTAPQQRPAAPAQGQQGQQRPASTATLHTPQGQGQQQRQRGPQVAPQQPASFDAAEDDIPF